MQMGRLSDTLNHEHCHHGRSFWYPKSDTHTSQDSLVVTGRWSFHCVQMPRALAPRSVYTFMDILTCRARLAFTSRLNRFQSFISYGDQNRSVDYIYISKNLFVGFEVLTAVVMESIIFWDITPYSPLSVNRRFGRTYSLHTDYTALYPRRWCSSISLYNYKTYIFLM
jgi:hypothetical protein